MRIGPRAAVRDGLSLSVVRATSLTSRDRGDVEALLHRDVEANLFLLGVLASGGGAGLPPGSWWGYGPPRTSPTERRHGGLSAMVFVASSALASGRNLAVPAGDPDGCEAIGKALGAYGPIRMVVGPREASDALWQGLGDPRARIRYEQRLYVCTRVTDGPELEIRTATLGEADALADMAGQMMLEDLGEDPRVYDREGHRRLVAERIRAGRTMVGVDGDRVVFKVDVGTRFDRGCQVGGTFVPPDLRGRGLATRGMRAVCRRLVAAVPMVTLHVNEANAPAVRCYEAVGFRRSAPFRLMTL
jgi:ribosomal protein S18 acetylase RimI-like enzyme